MAKRAKKSVSPAKPPKASPRDALLRVLAEMPDEAFGWLAVQIMSGIWPSGLGGFQPASKAAITRARAAAKTLLEAHG